MKFFGLAINVTISVMIFILSGCQSNQVKVSQEESVSSVSSSQNTLLARYAESAVKALQDLAETDKAILARSSGSQQSVTETQVQTNDGNNSLKQEKNHYQQITNNASSMNKEEKDVNSRMSTFVQDKTYGTVIDDLRNTEFQINFTGEVEQLLQRVVLMFPEQSGWKLSLPAKRPATPLLVTVTGKTTFYDLLQTVAVQLGSKVEIVVNERDHIVIVRYGVQQ